MPDVQLLTRTLKQGDHGLDVEGAHRTILRYLDARDNGRRLALFNSKPASVRQEAGKAFFNDVVRVRKLEGFDSKRIFGQQFWNHLSRQGWPDQRALRLLADYIDAHQRPPLVFPVPQGEMGRVCQGLHETAGIKHNWAIDFCCPDGTTIVAVEVGTVTYLSGHPPSADTYDSQGIFGWSLHFKTPLGYEYYVTHLGQRFVTRGEHLEAGDTIGKVGDQRYRPDHVHYGVTSPHGDADAKKRIEAISLAPRID
jgi:murein DD-endopeptidase MepM/ murein hydrolase activator NlpD